jgi:hypothetical protein
MEERAPLRISSIPYYKAHNMIELKKDYFREVGFTFCDNHAYQNQQSISRILYQSFKETFCSCSARGMDEPEMIFQFVQLKFFGNFCWRHCWINEPLFAEREGRGKHHQEYPACWRIPITGHFSFPYRR